MARKRHTAEEIVTKLRQVDVLTSQGRPVAEAVRTIGVTEVTYYRWRSEYGGLKGDQVKRLKTLESENKQPGDKPDLRFSVIRTDAPGVSIDQTWFSMSLRASATDHMNYKAVAVPAALTRPFTFQFRYQFRDPATPVVATP